MKPQDTKSPPIKQYEVNNKMITPKFLKLAKDTKRLQTSLGSKNISPCEKSKQKQ